MQFFFIAEIIIGKGFVGSRGARDLVHSCAGDSPLSKNFSRGNNDSPHRRKLAALPHQAAPDGRQLPLAHKDLMGSPLGHFVFYHPASPSQFSPSPKFTSTS